MARAAIDDVIARLRLLISDPAGASQIFTDDELEDFLDARRTLVVERELDPVYSRNGSGTLVALRYTSDWAPWATDATVTDEAGATAAASSADHTNGIWTFASDMTPPLYVSGDVFDLYGAAADALDAWAAKLALDFDFEADGQSFSRSQKRAALVATAMEYRRQAMPVSIATYRTDLA